jgi:uncharacterized protein (TIGR03067 family)
LKQDETNILDAARATMQDNRDNDVETFKTMLTQKKLVQPMAGNVSIRTTAPSSLGETYSTEFKLQFLALEQSMRSLENFDADKKYSSQPFGLIAFVPNNRSDYANKISPETKEQGDNGRGYYSNTIIYFNPLPYELSLSKSQQDLRLSIRSDIDARTASGSEPYGSSLDGAWALTRSKEGSEWVDERENGFVVFRWQGTQLIFKSGKVFSRRKFSTDPFPYRKRVVFDNAENAKTPIGKSNGIYRIDGDKMLLVLLKDKKNRATEFPKAFSESDSTWMYEYERVK